jgi:lipoprotein signal peptidase
MPLLIGLAADLGTKSWSFRTVAPHPVALDHDRLVAEPAWNPAGIHARRAALPWGLMDLRLVLNPGAVFGIGAGHRWFFVLFTVAALGTGLFVFGRRTTIEDRLAHVSMGLVAAGGVGNLYDRVAFGRVRDFIQIMPGRSLPRDWTWPGTNNPELFPWVFNIADVLLFAGMIGLMIHFNRKRGLRRREAPARPDAAALAEPE